jgi:hypothetical protein
MSHVSNFDLPPNPAARMKSIEPNDRIMHFQKVFPCASNGRIVCQLGFIRRGMAIYTGAIGE